MANTAQKRDINILLVDDSEIVLIGLKFTLEDYGLNNVKCTSNEMIAVEEIKNGNYDLVLTDINMPTLTGYQISDVVRDINIKKNKNTKVFGISGSDLNQIITEGQANDYFDELFIKPLDTARLIECISRIQPSD